MRHFPAPTYVTVVPETVQIDDVVEVKLTVRPEVAVAREDTFNADPPRVCVPTLETEKEIDWVEAITKLASTEVAAIYFELPA
jgi:hypothetical protein